MRDQKLVILAIATEWWSHHGGLSTFNRDLCTAFAAYGCEVSCLVPEAAQDEIAAAAEVRVHLIGAPASPGLSAAARMCLQSAVPPNLRPDIIVGHGHVTGPIAAAIRATYFPLSHGIHFAHTAPAEIEPYKENRVGNSSQRAEAREKEEGDVAELAHLIVAVGPRLFREWMSYFHGRPRRPRLHPLVPGVGADSAVEGLPPAYQCLLVGRAEDAKLKGIDLAAHAVRLLSQRPGFQGAERPILVIRGAERDSGQELGEQLAKDWQLSLNQLRIKEYSADQALVREDIRRASVVLMPSRAEGFGLVALEATAAGVPVIVSEQSGFGELLTQIDGSRSHLGFKNSILKMVGDDDTDARQLADMIEFTLRNRDAAFARARQLRDILRAEHDWPRAIGSMLDALKQGTRPGRTDRDDLDGALKFADKDPIAAIAWAASAIERRLATIGKQLGIEDSSPASLAEILHERQVLSHIAFNSLVELFRRRDIAVHSDTSFSFSESTAEDYVHDVIRELDALPASLPEPTQQDLVMLVHRAVFVGSSREHLFINLTNHSHMHDLVVTHIWFDTSPEVHVLQARRPLPRRLRPQETWETWLAVELLPESAQAQPYCLARARLSTGRVVSSSRNDNVPEMGFVPGESKGN